MTDEQIVKALESCIKGAANGKCGEECPFKNTNICDNDLYAVETLALDLIERQQAVIEDLKADKEALINGQLTIQKMYIEARDKAVREFAKRLMDRIIDSVEESMDEPNGADYFIPDVYTDIDNLVKEMTDQKGGADEC